MHYVVPIEPVPYRYSADWRRWFAESWPDARFIDGEVLTDGIESGQFLDVFGTHYYKASQVQQIAMMLRDGRLADGDSLLFLDGWFPLEQVFYMLDCAKLDVKVSAIFHAGAYDANDFLYQRGLGVWADGVERSWLQRLDKVIVFSKYHANLLNERRGCPFHKMHVVPFPYKLEELDGHKNHRKSVDVLYPHRFAPEKHHPELVNALRESGLVVETTYGAPKEDVYEMMGCSKFVVSWNWQETFGIAMLEATYLGAYPLVPNRLSYPELYRKESVVGSIHDMIEHIKGGVQSSVFGPDAHEVIRATRPFNKNMKDLLALTSS